MDESINNASCLQRYVEGIPFARELKITIASVDRGSVSLRINPLPQLLNHFGSYQAGVLFTLGEVTGGILCGSFLDLSKNFLITQKGEIDFERPSGEPLIAEAHIDESEINRVLKTLAARRKITVELEVLITSESGHLVSKSRNFYYVRSGMPKSVTQFIKGKPVIS